MGDLVDDLRENAGLLGEMAADRIEFLEADREQYAEKVNELRAEVERLTERPDGIGNLRWVDIESGKIYGSPTASDAIDYAEQRLKDPGEMACVETDVRMWKCTNVLRAVLIAERECPACEYTATMDCCRWDPT